MKNEDNSIKTLMEFLGDNDKYIKKLKEYKTVKEEAKKAVVAMQAEECRLKISQEALQVKIDKTTPYIAKIESARSEILEQQKKIETDNEKLNDARRKLKEDIEQHNIAVEELKNRLKEVKRMEQSVNKRIDRVNEKECGVSEREKKIKEFAGTMH